MILSWHFYPLNLRTFSFIIYKNNIADVFCVCVSCSANKKAISWCIQYNPNTISICSHNNFYLHTNFLTRPTRMSAFIWSMPISDYELSLNILLWFEQNFRKLLADKRYYNGNRLRKAKPLHACTWNKCENNVCCLRCAS